MAQRTPDQESDPPSTPSEDLEDSGESYHPPKSSIESTDSLEDSQLVWTAGKYTAARKFVSNQEKSRGRARKRARHSSSRSRSPDLGFILKNRGRPDTQSTISGKHSQMTPQKPSSGKAHKKSSAESTDSLKDSQLVLIAGKYTAARKFASNQENSRGSAHKHARHSSSRSRSPDLGFILKNPTHIQSGALSASSSGSRSPSQKRARTQSGTMTGKTLQMTPKKLHKCVFGCTKLYPRLARHYMRKKHGLSREEAKRLAAPPIPTKSKSGRIRRVCPLCDSVTCKMSQHLRNKKIHPDLTEQEIMRNNRLATRFQGTVLSKATPTKQGHQANTSSPVREQEPSTTSKHAPPEGIEQDHVSEDRPAAHNDRRRSSDIKIGKSGRNYFNQVKIFYEWLQTHCGGGLSLRRANQTATELQVFFLRYGNTNVAVINEHNIMDFVSHLQKNLKASSILFYIRALLKYLDFLLLREEVTNARHSRLSLMIGNIRSSLEKTRKQDNVLLQVEAEQDKIPAAAPSHYFGSSYVKELQASLRSNPKPRQFVAYRNYILCALTLFNGQRPMVYRSLRILDIYQATVEVVEDDGPVEDRTYATIAEPKHKTMKTYGAAVLTVPMWFFQDILAFLSFADTLFLNRTSESPAFPVSSTGDAIEETSQVCEMIRSSWEKSGTKAAFPQKFNSTQTRKLLTTVGRDKDPTQAHLVAQQLCHTIGQANMTYRLRMARGQSSKAVHFLGKALKEAKERESRGTNLAVDYIQLPSASAQAHSHPNPIPSTSYQMEDPPSHLQVSAEIMDCLLDAVMHQVDPFAEIMDCLLDAVMHQVDPFPEIMDCLLDAVMHQVDPFAEIMDCLLDAVMHQVGHVPNYNIEEMWTRQINAITDAPPPLEEVTPSTSETGFQAEAINDDQARRRTFEWVQTVEPPLSFPDLPLKASQFYSSLGHSLSSLDWPNIEAESQYWAHQSSVTMMAQTTNHIRIAEGLEAIMEGRFCVNLFHTIEGEIQGHIMTSEQRLAATILVASRLGVIFGSTLIPTETPQVDKELLEETFARAKNKAGFLRKSNRSEDSHPDLDLPDLGSIPVQPVRENQSEGSKKKRTGKRARLSGELTELIRKIYADEIEVCQKTGKKTPMAAVRFKVEDIKGQFPHMTVMQIRDKIWTIANEK